MRALDLDLVRLRLLDEALHGELHPLLEHIVSLRTEPHLTAVRVRPHLERPSSWRLRVHGGGVDHDFQVPPANIVALGLCAQVWLADTADELKADLALGLHDANTEHALEQALPWPRGPRGSS